MVPLPSISAKTKEKLIFGTLATTLLAIVWALSFQFVAPLSGGTPLLTLSFYDVGQGDAILIEKGEIQVLVDGGPEDEILSYLGKDLPPWDRKIELMVLTHPHADHLTGLLSVLERYEVERILFYPVSYDTKGYQKFLKAIVEEGAVIWKGESGGVFSLSGISFRVLSPKATETQKLLEAQNVNNASVVLSLTFGEFDALLLGDAEKEAQNRFVPLVSEVEVLKIAHQGAQDAAYEPLLRQASPELAVISVGKNKYGHPHQSTRSLLAELGIKVLRTDLSGTIKVMSDGKKFWYTLER